MDRRARDVMTRCLTTVSPAMDLVSLARLFRERDITGAPVVDEEGVWIGMVSQTDLTRARATDDDLHDLFFSPTGREARLEALRDEEYGPYPGDPWGLEEGGGLVVADVMNRSLHCIEAEATLAQVSRAMLELRVRRLVVVEGGRFVGLVTATDVLRGWSAEVEELRARVRRVAAGGDPRLELAA